MCDNSLIKRLESKLNQLEKRVCSLEKENKQLRKENRQLKKENKELKAKLKAYENSNTPSSKKRNKKQTKGPYKKSGRKKGHEGSGRPYPKPNEELEFSSSCCPNCSSFLINKIGEDTIIQEEISKPEPVRVIKNKIFNYKCQSCKRHFEAKNDVLKNSRIGINLATEIIMSKYEERLTLQKIQNRLMRRHNCYISKAGILGVITRVCNYLTSQYNQLLSLVVLMKFIYADETSWRIKGQNHWLWSFCNKLISVFMIRKSRGRKPVEEILNNYLGIIISDGWKVYEKFCKKQQRCWSHLLREARDDYSHFVEGRAMISNLENLFKSAKEASKLKSLHEREKNYKFHINQMKHLILICKSHKSLRKFAKTIENGLNSWFTAILEPEIEFTNNRAERELREPIVLRKISGGFQAQSGAKSFEVIMSLIMTFKKQGKDLHEGIKNALIKEQLRIGV